MVLQSNGYDVTEYSASSSDHLNHRTRYLATYVHLVAQDNPESHYPHIKRTLELNVTHLLHSCYNVVTLLLHCCYTVVTILLHCCTLTDMVAQDDP
jgi:hypothetical protein